MISPTTYLVKSVLSVGKAREHHTPELDDQRASDTASRMRLLVGKAAARARPAALLLGAKGGTHARRGIRSGSKLIESLDMAQTPLESGGDSNQAKGVARWGARRAARLARQSERLDWRGPECCSSSQAIVSHRD
jgi:hypothetical protein